MESEWRPIPGFDGYYEVSNDGRVRSFRNRFGWPRRNNPVELKAVVREKTGYVYVGLRNSEGARNESVHYLVMLAFVGARPPGHQVNHIDGCKTNNNLSNLEYCTPRQNIHHAMRLGLRKPRTTNVLHLAVADSQMKTRIQLAAIWGRYRHAGNYISHLIEQDMRSHGIAVDVRHPGYDHYGYRERKEETAPDLAVGQWGGRRPYGKDE